MKLIIEGKEFINKLTANRLTETQVNKALVYLRAKKILFYDNWSKKHCLIYADLLQNKRIIIDALKIVTN